MDVLIDQVGTLPKKYHAQLNEHFYVGEAIKGAFSFQVYISLPPKSTTSVKNLFQSIRDKLGIETFLSSIHQSRQISPSGNLHAFSGVCNKDSLASTRFSYAALVAAISSITADHSSSAAHLNAVFLTYDCKKNLGLVCSSPDSLSLIISEINNLFANTIANLNYDIGMHVFPQDQSLIPFFPTVFRQNHWLYDRRHYPILLLTWSSKIPMSSGKELTITLSSSIPGNYYFLMPKSLSSSIFSPHPAYFPFLYTIIPTLILLSNTWHLDIPALVNLFLYITTHRQNSCNCSTPTYIYGMIT